MKYMYLNLYKKGAIVDEQKGEFYVNLVQMKNDTALYHYTSAYHLAEAIHNNSQAATYLALIGDTLRRQGEKAQAVSRMEQACEVAAHTEQATLGHVLQLLAYTYADMGNAKDFDNTIAKTTDLLAFSSDATDSARKEFVPFEVYEIRGKASRDLGRSPVALQYLELAEKALVKAEAPPRWYAVLDISRGQVYCDMGDIATGVTFASQGFIKAYYCNSLRQMNRVRKLVRKLEESQWKHEQPVANLKELLYETYLRMDPDR